MAIIKGKYYYKGKRQYKYDVKVLDAEDFTTHDFNIRVTNPEGKTVIVSWNFRQRGIEQAIHEYIELMVKKKMLNKT